jgi:hypothetical protein
MRATNRQIKALGPALLGSPAGKACPAPLACKATTFHGARYLLAVNPARTAVRGRLSLRSVRGSVRMYGTNRRIATSGGAFADTLPALTARIYIAPPA